MDAESLRMYSCAECGALVLVCARCDGGQVCCADRESECRELRRVAQRRASNRRHQQSKEGREDHRDHMRAYRARCSVTDQRVGKLPSSPSLSLVREASGESSSSFVAHKERDDESTHYGVVPRRAQHASAGDERRGDLTQSEAEPGALAPASGAVADGGGGVWEGAPVRAVISADAQHDGYGSRFWDAVGMDFGGALYSLGLGGPERGRRQLSFFEDSMPELDGLSDLEAAAVSAALGGDR